jgi:hypothetical protein
VTEIVSDVRYEVVPEDTSLTFEARSTLHPVHGKIGGVSGFIVAAAGAGPTAPPIAKIHVEFPVEQMRSGNSMQDREMRKVIDSGRFPRVAADLRELEPSGPDGHYAAGGDITLAGRVRRYSGDLVLHVDGSSVTLEGELSIDIRDFGLQPPAMLGLRVDPIVVVRVRLVAAKSG